MFSYHRLFKASAISFAVISLVGGAPTPADAKTHNVDCTKNNSVQKTIDSAADGDVIEISGVCMENLVIRGKGLRLVGAAGPGPHGITGVAANTDGIRVENSRGTQFEGLVISNPHFTGMRIMYHSSVEMTDCEISGSGAGAGTAIWTQFGSQLFGLRLRLENNLRGLGGAQQSRVFCYECDLNNNVRWAATATQNSLVTLLDSTVTGSNGINSIEDSYVDIDCQSHDSAHDCSLSVSGRAEQAVWGSTVAFYGSGNFDGQLLAIDRAKVNLLGARQQSTGTDGAGNPRSNFIGDESSLRVEPFHLGGVEVESSRLTGVTDVTEFARAMVLGDSTVFDGTINCSAAGDAWVDAGVDVAAGASFNGCDHAP